MQNNLEKLIRDIITVNGNIGVDDFMRLVIPYYYEHSNPFGEKGDFITAPETSQMFGEIIGIWCATEWMKFGKPFSLVEMGAGRGLMLSDVLRSTKNIPGMHECLREIYIIETSSSLIEIQKKNLAEYIDKIVWLDNIQDLPNTDCIFISNEFFDALPIKQFQCKNDALYEVRIGLKGEMLDFFLSPSPTKLNSADIKEGEIIEINYKAKEIVSELLDKVSDNWFAFITIDYGYVNAPMKSTLQAIKSHKKIGVFEDMGSADLTALVDFSTLANCFKKGASLVTQAEFLLSHGIELRAQKLIENGADPKVINNQLEKLISPGSMGELFKVLMVSSPHS